MGKQWLNQIWVTVAIGPRGNWWAAVVFEKLFKILHVRLQEAAIGYRIVSRMVQICMHIWVHFPI